MLISLLEIVLGIIGLSLIVLVHEAGHFIAARAMGIRVETFSIGFGKRLAGYKRNGTDFRLSLIPLGGYCRFSGEESFRRAIDEKLDSIPSEKGEYYGAAPWRRIVVALSGPLANLLFAVLVFTMVNWIGFTVYYQEPRILLYSDYSGEPGPADDAGLENGDLIVAADGRELQSFSDFREELVFRPDEEIELLVRRDGRDITTVITPELDRERGLAIIGVYNWVDAIVFEIVPESAAEKAGLLSGDRIVRVGDREIMNTLDWEYALQESPDGTIPIDVERNGSIRALGFDTAHFRPDGSTGLIFNYRTGRSESLGPLRSIGRGISDTAGILTSTVRGLRMLFLGIKVQNAVSGPARLITETGDLIRSGFSDGFGPGMYWSFNLFAIISISLAFLNLLPIPVLDGGQILLFLTEWIRQKPIRPGSVYRYQIAGTIIVLIIFVAASAGDVMHFSGR